LSVHPDCKPIADYFFNKKWCGRDLKYISKFCKEIQFQGVQADDLIDQVNELIKNVLKNFKKKRKY